MKELKVLYRLLLVLLVVPFIGACDKLPEEVEISDIPSYYFDNDYLDNRVAAINDAIADCAGDCETFFWITDIHWEPDLNARVSPVLIKYIASKTGVNKILNGGDTGNSQVICKNAISQLRDAIGSNKVYTVTGNHEINDASRYERPFVRVADELRGHNSDIVYGDGNKSYFYFDNNEAKTRFIGLSVYGVYRNGEHESCLTAAQLQWFNNTALNVETGWTIVVFTHTLYFVAFDSNKLGVSSSDAIPFINAIDNYSGNGKIACVLMGHVHRDRIHLGSTGVPYIITQSDRHSPYHGDINVQRTPGTITEQHFEVVVIDKGKRQVKLFSIGAKARDGQDDDPGNEVDVRTVNY